MTTRARAYNNRTLVALMARRSVIIGELAKLSHNGWVNARPIDYKSLEDELARLNIRRNELEQEQ